MTSSKIESTAINSTPPACVCGKRLPAALSLHVYKCECGRLWVRPDCSEVCTSWEAY